MRVLVVEDHPKLATALGTVLRREGMAVDIVFDGHDALAHVAATAYDVVVLDRDLPGVSGDDVCRSLVAGSDDTRVLMLTAAATIDDRVDGLGIGADDYLAKPFAFPELVARIRALARRARPMLPPTLVYSDVRLDSNSSSCDPGRAAIGAPSKGVRCLGAPPRRRGCGGICRGDPRPCVGRGS